MTKKAEAAMAQAEQAKLRAAALGKVMEKAKAHQAKMDAQQGKSGQKRSRADIGDELRSYDKKVKAEHTPISSVPQHPSPQLPPLPPTPAFTPSYEDQNSRRFAEFLEWQSHRDAAERTARERSIFDAAQATMQRMVQSQGGPALAQGRSGDSRPPHNPRGRGRGLFGSNTQRPPPPTQGSWD